MTQRIKKIIYQRPNVSTGNSTDAILPGGPIQPDFFFRRDVILVQAPYVPPPPVSYVLWEWNGTDTSQFEMNNIIIVSGSSGSPPSIPSQSISVESMSALSDEQNKVVASAVYYPTSDNADSGSVLNFHIFSGTRGGFFVPISDFDPTVNQDLGGFTVEVQILSRSNFSHGGASSANTLEFSVVAAEVVNGRLNSIGANISYNNQSIGRSVTNKDYHTYNAFLQSNGMTDYPPFYASMEFKAIPSGSSRWTTHINAGTTAFSANGQDIWLLGSQKEILTATSNFSFLSSGFCPNKFGIVFWTTTPNANSYNLYVRSLRIVKPLPARLTYTSEYAPQVLGHPTIQTASFGPISSSTISLQNQNFKFFKWLNPPLGPYRETYEWRRNGSAIPFATASTYKIGSSDIGQNLEGFVFASNSVGLAVASASIVPIVGFPSISGSGMFSYFGTAENLSESAGRVALLYDSMQPSGSRVFQQNTGGSRPFPTSSNGRQWIRTWLGSGSAGFSLGSNQALSNFISASAYHCYTVFSVASASLNAGNVWQNHYVIADPSGYFGVFVRKQAENDYWAYCYHWDGSARTIQFPINLNETYCMEVSFSSSVLSARINSSSFQTSTSIGNISSLGVFPTIGSTSYPLFGTFGAVAIVGGKKFDTEESQLYMEVLSRSWGFNL